MFRTILFAAPLLAALGLPAVAQPAPSGTPDRPTATGAGSTAIGSPSMKASPTREPGTTATTGTNDQPPGAQVPTQRTNGRQDRPTR